MTDAIEQRGGQDGFTLIEIMVVVLILGLLATLVAVNVMSKGEHAKKELARTQLETFEQSIKMFKLDTGRLPTTGEGLSVLIPPAPSDAPNYEPDGYLDEVSVPLDPWDHDYEYQTDGKKFTVVSYGPDGVESEDDLTNWSTAK